MGAVLAKFRKEKSTTKLLEVLEEKIQQLEKYTINTQEQKRRFVFNFLTISIGIYVIAFLIFYFLYFPPTWNERIIYSIPLLLFPLVIVLLRKLFTWYFQRKLNKNSSKLTALRDEKKKILEQVMDKETYKVAVGLLQRFGDKTGPSKYSLSMTTRNPSSSSSMLLNQSSRSLNVSAVTPLNTTNKQKSLVSSVMQTPLSSAIKPPLGSTISNTNLRALSLTPQSTTSQELRRRTPFPIVNQQDKSVFERVVDLLVGDGPQDRFAMICKHCFAHNGMALKEEFDYVTFRCAFCSGINPSRKARPVAPRLPAQFDRSLIQAKNSSDSSTSADESDNENESRRKVPIKILTEVATNSTTDKTSDSDTFDREKCQLDAEKSEKVEEVHDEEVTDEIKKEN